MHPLNLDFDFLNLLGCVGAIIIVIVAAHSSSTAVVRFFNALRRRALPCAVRPALSLRKPTGQSIPRLARVRGQRGPLAHVAVADRGPVLGALELWASYRLFPPLCAAGTASIVGIDPVDAESSNELRA